MSSNVEAKIQYSKLPGGEIGIITINRPKEANSMLSSMWGEVNNLIQKAAIDEQLKVLVITANGKFFCTGADVLEASRMFANVKKEPQSLQHVLTDIVGGPFALSQTITDFPKFIVAAVNGPAVGYGAAFLGLFDLVYASTSASVYMPFIQLGVAAEGASSLLFPATIGRSKTTDMYLNGRTLSSSEMVSSGLAASVFPDENFLAAVLKRLTKGAAASPMGSILATKALMMASRKQLITQTNRLEIKACKQQIMKGEAMQRFQQKSKTIGKAKL